MVNGIMKMGKVYRIISRCYTTGKLAVLKTSTNIRDMLELIEQYAQEYVGGKMGEKNLGFYLRGKKYNLCPYGYFICKHDRFNKFTVMRKYINAGYLYGTTKIDKVVDFQICEENVASYGGEMPDASVDIDEREEIWEPIHKLIRKQDDEKV